MFYTKNTHVKSICSFKSNDFFYHIHITTYRSSMQILYYFPQRYHDICLSLLNHFKTSSCLSELHMYSFIHLKVTCCLIL